MTQVIKARAILKGIIKMNTDNKNKLEFYGGTLGAILPMITIFVGIMALVIMGYSAAKTFWAAGLAALMLAFLLAKNKNAFNNTVLKGLQNPLMAVMVMAFYLAGIVAALLKAGGLVDGLLWAASEINMGAQFIPAIAFLVCVVISVCTGTTGGTVSAVTPVMLPFAVKLGCDPALMMGAILSGSFFGDNLAPVSDTTIASAYTQETEVPKVVKSRIKYSVIAGAIALVLYIIFGHTMVGAAPANLDIDPGAAKSLILLLSPVVLVIMMVKGLSLVPALLACNLVTMILSLATGLISFDQMIGPEGVIISGIEGMIFLTVFCVFIFALVEMMNESGVFDKLIDRATANVNSARQAEGLAFVMVAVVTAMTAAATVAIVMCGPVMRKIFKKFHLNRERGANILDGTACGIGGMTFWNLSCLSAYTLAMSTGVLDESFSIMSAVPYTFHCIALVGVYIIAIITGFGRKYETPEEAAEMDAKIGIKE